MRYFNYTGVPTPHGHSPRCRIKSLQLCQVDLRSTANGDIFFIGAELSYRLLPAPAVAAHVDKVVRAILKPQFASCLLAIYSVNKGRYTHCLCPWTVPMASPRVVFTGAGSYYRSSVVHLGKFSTRDHKEVMDYILRRA